jgi:hypothetical protein
MSSIVVARHPVTKALVTMLNAAPKIALPPGDTQGVRAAVGEAPPNLKRDQQGRLVHGYLLVYPLSSPLFWGSIDSPEECLTGTYQVTSVGRTDEHAAALDDEVRRAITQRTAGGGWVNPIAAAGHSVIDRRARESGGPEPQSGGIWQVPSVYDLEVQGHG